MSDVKRLVHPDCCDMMRKCQSISLSLPGPFYGNEPEVPRWEITGWRLSRLEMVRVQDHIDGHNVESFNFPPESEWPTPDTEDWLTPWHYEASHCPFCGESMPPIVERFNPPSPICTCTDGGYYCATCDERLMCCQCWPPQWKFMPYKYYPDFGDDKECQCGHPYYRHFDSYDDMRAIGCKYCECHIFEAKK